jgi:hypothetical protein
MIDSTDAPEGYYAAPIEETRKYVTKCKGCAFLKETELLSKATLSRCFGSERNDGTAVIFKKLSDTEAISDH